MDIGIVSQQSSENIKMGTDSKEIAKNYMKLSKLEYDKAKARLKFAKIDLYIAKLREETAIQSAELFKQKLNAKAKGFLETSSEELIHEQKQIKMSTLTAAIQLEISKINKNIANLEIEIAKEKEHLGKSKINLSDIQLNLGSSQNSYVQMAENHKPEEKMQSLERDILKIEKSFHLLSLDIMKKEKQIMDLENKLIDNKNTYSLKLAEYSKVKEESN